MTTIRRILPRASLTGYLILARMQQLVDLVDQLRYGYMPITAKTADYTADNTDFTILVSTASGDITITLPAAANGKRFTIKKIDANAYNVIVDGAGAETIDGAATHTLSSQYDVVRIIAASGNWYTI